MLLEIRWQQNKTGYAIQFERPYMTYGTENESIRLLTNLLDSRGGVDRRVTHSDR